MSPEEVYLRVIEADRPEKVLSALAEVWKSGFDSGKSRAMRFMSDEPGLSLDVENPFEVSR